jgi:hypothetical protein
LFGDAGEEMKIGDIQNRWLFSTIRMLQKSGGIIQKLFKTSEFNAEGLYVIKICKNGEWQDVFVDDFIPCYPKSGQILSNQG